MTQLCRFWYFDIFSSGSNRVIKFRRRYAADKKSYFVKTFPDFVNFELKDNGVFLFYLL